MAKAGVVSAVPDTDDPFVSAAKTVKKPKSDTEAETRGKQKRPMDHMRAFKEADKNQDGFLTIDEFSKMARLTRIGADKRASLFKFLDKNSDGKLYHREIHPTEHGRFGKLIAGFRRFDTDQSGGLSLVELKEVPIFKKMEIKHMEKMFRGLDRNGDDQIERSELMRANKRDRPVFNFAKHDKDGSGGLNFEEYSTLPFMNRVSKERRTKIFKRIDLDQNQELSHREINHANHGKRGRQNEGEENNNRGKRKPFSPQDGSRGGAHFF